MSSIIIGFCGDRNLLFPHALPWCAVGGGWLAVTVAPHRHG